MCYLERITTEERDYFLKLHEIEPYRSIIDITDDIEALYGDLETAC